MNIKQTLTIPGRAATLPICFIAGKNPPIPIKNKRLISKKSLPESLKERFTSNKFWLYIEELEHAFEDIWKFQYSLEILCVIWCHLHNFKSIKNTYGQPLNHAFLSTVVFPPKFSFFTVCLVNYLWKCSQTGKLVKFGSPGCWKMHFRACKSFACSDTTVFVFIFLLLLLLKL